MFQEKMGRVRKKVLQDLHDVRILRGMKTIDERFSALFRKTTQWRLAKAMGRANWDQAVRYTYCARSTLRKSWAGLSEDARVRVEKAIAEAK